MKARSGQRPAKAKNRETEKKKKSKEVKTQTQNANATNTAKNKVGREGKGTKHTTEGRARETSYIYNIKYQSKRESDIEARESRHICHLPSPISHLPSSTKHTTHPLTSRERNPKIRYSYCMVLQTAS